MRIMNSNGKVYICEMDQYTTSHRFPPIYILTPRELRGGGSRAGRSWLELQFIHLLNVRGKALNSLRGIILQRQP